MSFLLIYYGLNGSFDNLLKRYVWVKDGRIYAKRNENSAQIIINNQSDIEKINADQ